MDAAEIARYLYMKQASALQLVVGESPQIVIEGQPVRLDLPPLAAATMCDFVAHALDGPARDGFIAARYCNVRLSFDWGASLHVLASPRRARLLLVLHDRSDTDARTCS